MRILALETSGVAGSVALFSDDLAVAVHPLPPQQRSGKSLARGIYDVLAEACWSPASLDLVGVTNGPGSFTGLRVGVTTAKVLAYAAGADLVAIDTLWALAWQVPLQRGAELVALLEAYRSQWYQARFAATDEGWLPLGPTSLVDRALAFGQLAPSTLVTGDVLANLPGGLPPHLTGVDRTWWSPSARSVGQLALRAHRGGQRDDLWTLAPKYLRPSAAEEKRQAAIAMQAAAVIPAAPN